MPTRRNYLSDLAGTGGRVSPFHPVITDLLSAYEPLSDASNTSPIRITDSNHSLQTGDVVHVRNVVGNVAANGIWPVTRININVFSLNGSAGSGIHVPGTGQWREEGTTTRIVAGSAVGEYAFVSVKASRHARLIADPRVDVLLDGAFDLLWGSVGTPSSRAAFLVRMAARGWSTVGITDATPYGLIIRRLGQRYEPLFHESSFSAP